MHTISSLEQIWKVGEPLFLFNRNGSSLFHDDPLSGRADLNRRPPAPHAGALNLAALRPDFDCDYNPAIMNRQCYGVMQALVVNLPSITLPEGRRGGVR